MTRILLIRHGHVAGIVPKRFRGRVDLPLSEDGHRQARDAAAYIAARYQPAAIYSSPLQRCRDCAIVLADLLSMPLPQVRPQLNDIDYGLWQGRLATEVAQAEPQRYAQWQHAPAGFTFPQGESLAMVADRTRADLAAVAQRHGGQTIAVYTHDSVIRVLLLAALAASFSAYHRMEIDPCSLSELVSGSSGDTVVRTNERTTAVI
jgi:probable phosphoglycerate mutase